MSSKFIDSYIFDSKPLDKKNQKQKLECQLKQKLEKAIEQCLSQYMLTSFKKQISRDFHNNQHITSKKGSEIQSLRASDEIKNIVLDLKSNRKSARNELIHRVKSNIQSLASSILRVFEGQSSSYEDQRKSLSLLELNQSNKLFLVELFTEFGLLRNYLQMDRSFIKLVNQAQREYFEIKKNVQNLGTQMIQKLSSPCFTLQSEVAMEKGVDIGTLSTFYSAKKRIFDTLQLQESEMKRTLKSGQSVVGYTSKLSKQNFIEEQTKETSNFPINSKQSSSLPSGLYFLDFNGERSQQKESQFKQLHDDLFAKVYERYRKYDKF